MLINVVYTKLFTGSFTHRRTGNRPVEWKDILLLGCKLQRLYCASLNVVRTNSAATASGFINNRQTR